MKICFLDRYTTSYLKMSKELFIERAKEYFGDEYAEFMAEIDKPCTQGFFLNVKKDSRENILNIIDFPYEVSDLTDESFYHHHDNIGKTIAYDLGLIYPQEIAASLTSRSVDRHDISVVVDMCAAPGGKTINILNRLPDDVLCISNDVSHSRSLIMSQNLERTGLDNVIITNKNCDQLAKQLEGCADIVILDAPCSGEGIIRKYPEIFDEYSIERISELAAVQKELLDHAYRMLKGGGQLIYSTCTYSYEEDEKQVMDFLSRYPDMYIKDIDIPSSSRLKGAVKLSPINGTEGQFFVIMRKEETGNEHSLKMLKPVTDKTADDFIRDNLMIDDYCLYEHNGHYYLSLIPLPDLGNNIIRYGICLGEIRNGRFEPNHHLYRANSLIGRYRYTCELDDEQYSRYIEGYELKIDLTNNYYHLTYKNNSLGFGKCVNGTLKNKYPKGLRRVV